MSRPQLRLRIRCSVPAAIFISLSALGAVPPAPPIAAGPVSDTPILAKVRESASSGDLDAKYHLAQIYEQGRHDVMPDLAEAARWYRSAASAGHVASQRRLAIMHLHGQGVPQSFDQAQHWFFLAANKNDVEAQYHLAILFITGRGMPRSVDNAIKWFNAAAQSGHAPAQVELGRLYLSGDEVTQNTDLGLSWVRKAANRQDPDALYLLGQLHVKGDVVSHNPGRARAYFEQAANAGHADAQVWIGDWYCQQDPPDYDSALRYYRMASDQASPAGYYGLARIHLERLSHSPDIRAGLTALQRAVDANYPDAIYLMGMIIADGALPGGSKEAVFYWERAATMGHLEAQYQLGITYYQGAKAIPKSLATAEQWWKEAAKHGHPASQYAYGVMHLNGVGVHQNPGVGYALVNISAAQGHVEAKALREQLRVTLPDDTLRSAQLLSVELFEKYVDPSLRASTRDLLQ